MKLEHAHVAQTTVEAGMLTEVREQLGVIAGPRRHADSPHMRSPPIAIPAMVFPLSGAVAIPAVRLQAVSARPAWRNPVHR
jgi:hypothetical protein